MQKQNTKKYKNSQKEQKLLQSQLFQSPNLQSIEFPVLDMSQFESLDSIVQKKRRSSNARLGYIENSIKKMSGDSDPSPLLHFQEISNKSTITIEQSKQSIQQDFGQENVGKGEGISQKGTDKQKDRVYEKEYALKQRELENSQFYNSQNQINGVYEISDISNKCMNPNFNSFSCHTQNMTNENSFSHLVLPAETQVQQQQQQQQFILQNRSYSEVLVQNPKNEELNRKEKEKRRVSENINQIFEGNYDHIEIMEEDSSEEEKDPYNNKSEDNSRGEYPNDISSNTDCKQMCNIYTSTEANNSNIAFAVINVANICSLVFYSVAILEENFGEKETWIQKNQYSNLKWHDIYIQSLYFSFVTMVTVGYGDITPTTRDEKVILIFIAIISCGVFAFAVNTIDQIFRQIQMNESTIKKKKFKVSQYMAKRNISKENQLKVIKILEFLDQQEEQENTEGLEILQSISKNVQESVFQEYYGQVLRNTRLAKTGMFSDEFLQSIALKMKECTYGPQTTIYQQGKSDSRFFIFIEGVIEVYLEGIGEDKEQKILKILKGKQQQDLSFDQFYTEQAFGYSVRSTSVSRLVYFEKNEFLEQLNKFPDDFEKFHLLKDTFIFANSHFQMCYICHSNYHSTVKCPTVFFVGKSLKTIQQYNYPVQQQRLRYYRRPKFLNEFQLVFNTLCDIDYQRDNLIKVRCDIISNEISQEVTYDLLNTDIEFYYCYPKIQFKKDNGEFFCEAERQNEPEDEKFFLEYYQNYGSGSGSGYQGFMCNSNNNNNNNINYNNLQFNCNGANNVCSQMAMPPQSYTTNYKNKLINALTNEDSVLQQNQSRNQSKNNGAIIVENINNQYSNNIYNNNVQQGESSRNLSVIPSSYYNNNNNNNNSSPINQNVNNRRMSIASRNSTWCIVNSQGEIKIPETPLQQPQNLQKINLEYQQSIQGSHYFQNYCQEQQKNSKFRVEESPMGCTPLGRQLSTFSQRMIGSQEEISKIRSQKREKSAFFNQGIVQRRLHHMEKKLQHQQSFDSQQQQQSQNSIVVAEKILQRQQSHHKAENMTEQSAGAQSPFHSIEKLISMRQANPVATTIKNKQQQQSINFSSSQQTISNQNNLIADFLNNYNKNEQDEEEEENKTDEQLDSDSQQQKGETPEMEPEQLEGIKQGRKRRLKKNNNFHRGQGSQMNYLQGDNCDKQDTILSIQNNNGNNDVNNNFISNMAKAMNAMKKKRNSTILSQQEIQKILQNSNGIHYVKQQNFKNQITKCGYEIDKMQNFKRYFPQYNVQNVQIRYEKLRKFNIIKNMPQMGKYLNDFSSILKDKKSILGKKSHKNKIRKILRTPSAIQ